MPTNDFKAFATGVGANVITQAAYAALASLIANGFSAGIANSDELNKVWRQGNFVASSVAQFMMDELGIDILDDGDQNTFVTNFTNAVRAVVSNGQYAVDSGASANHYVVAMAPAIAAYSGNIMGVMKAAHTSTGASDMDAGGGVKTLLNNAGGAIGANDIVANHYYMWIYVAAADEFFILTTLPSQLNANPYFSGYQIFTASGTYTKPANLSFVRVTVIGGGGGGAGAASGTGNGGGGGGGASIKRIAAGSLGATETVTVGTGGGGGAAGANSGTGGNTSSFGAHCSATGGAGGTIPPGGAGGVGSGGDLNIAGGGGGAGAASLRGSGVGGSTILGGGGAGVYSNSNGLAGGAYGGGGSGAESNTGNFAGGNGTDGVVIVEEYKTI